MDQPITLLLVEDDEKTAVPIILGLQDEGFRVLHAVDGHWGLRLARAAHPDLILLDTELPRMDGFALCRALRQGTGLPPSEPWRMSTVPILMLVSRRREVDRIRGLELGADGCLVKPFDFQELLARIRALLRRRRLNRGELTPPGMRIVVGEIVLDRMARQVWWDGRLVQLRQREFDLLCVLMENAGKAVSRQELLDRVWGKDWVGSPRTIDVHIRWLRQKLEDDPSAPRYIQTIRGYGHRFAAPETAAAT